MSDNKLLKDEELNKVTGGSEENNCPKNLLAANNDLCGDCPYKTVESKALDL